MTARPLRLPIVLTTVLVMLLTACSTSDQDDPPDAAAERAPFAPGPYREGDLDADVAALASWGIPTYQDEHATEPMVEVADPGAPLRLLRSQVEVMGSEAAAGVGTLGSDLDAVFAIGAGSELRMSSLLTAWLQSGSDMATSLRESLTAVDLEHPAEAVFPTIVLTGFIRDMGLAPADAATGAASPAVFTRAAAAIDPCSVSSDWVEGMIAKLFAGLEIRQMDTSDWSPILQPLGWLANQLISVYDAIRRGAEWIVINSVRVLVAPIRNVLAQVSLLVAVVQTALTSIHPLASSWTGPGNPEFGVLGDAELRYETTVHVRSTNPLVWPEVLRRCARAAGVELPNPTLEDSLTTWGWRTAEGGVIRELTSDRWLKPDEGGGGQATFRFATGQEPRDWKERGDTNLVQTIVTATVLRKNKQIRDAVSHAVGRAVRELLGFLPDFLKKHAAEAVLQAIDPLLQELVVRSEYRTATSFYVKRHMRPEETPTPTPTMPTPSPPPPRPQPVWVYVDRPGVPGSVEPGRILQLVACGGLAGTWRGKLRTGGLYDDDGFTVPWADLPVRPFRIGNGGIGVATSRASGTTYVLGNAVRVTYDLRIRVDGRTMTIDGVPVQPPVSFRGITIRKAPAAVCP